MMDKSIQITNEFAPGTLQALALSPQGRAEPRTPRRASTRASTSIRLLFIIYYLLFFFPLAADSLDESPCDLMPSGVTVDLREPILTDGELFTDQGGVITAPEFRLQAKQIRVRKILVGDSPAYTVNAEGDLILEYGDYVFTGSSLEYDFATRYGIIRYGRSARDPWYFGANEIEILPNGHYLLHDGYATTSPSYCPDWGLYTQYAHLTPDHCLYARHLTFRLADIPLLWAPSYKTSLDRNKDSPLKYRFRMGGKQGPRAGVWYRLWQNDRFEAAVLMDYRLSRGPGAALETEFCDPATGTLWQTRNYAARDSSLSNPNERFRYRLQGLYNRCFCDSRLSLGLSYDKISDKDMPTDYADADLDILTSGLTQLKMRTQTNYLIGNLGTRVRVNSFETLKEEIPTACVSFHPLVLGPTGIISENLVKAGYFDFRYSEDMPSVPDFNSTRAEMRHTLYRPFIFGPLNLTPDAGVVAIYYGNDPKHTPIWMVLGAFGGQFNTHLYRCYGQVKHVIEPYARYQYLTKPNTDPTKRFVFDIHDGWYTVNSLRFGLRNLLYQKICDDDCPKRAFSADLYAFTFFNTNKVKDTIPRVFGKATWEMTPWLRHTIRSAWDFERQEVDHVNYRADWTASENLAVAVEYRHRSPFCWRKADPQNLMLDFFRSEADLRDSQLSDQRDTALLHMYWRLQHNLSLEFEMRRGWNRLDEPNYNEYQIDMVKTVRSSWTVTASYQKKQDDHRVAFYLNLGIKKPKNPCYSPYWGSCCDE